MGMVSKTNRLLREPVRGGLGEGAWGQSRVSQGLWEVMMSYFSIRTLTPQR